MRYDTPAKKCKLDSAWVGPYLIVSLAGWALGIQRHPDSPIVLVHCQDLKKVPQPSGVVSWLEAPRPTGAPAVQLLGASTMGHTSLESPSVAILLEGAVLADVVSVGSVGSLSGSRADYLERRRIGCYIGPLEFCHHTVLPVCSSGGCFVRLTSVLCA